MNQLFDSFGKVRAMDFETELSEVPFESDSSAGFQLRSKKGEKGGDVHRRAIRQANALIRTIEGADDKPSALEEAILNSVPDVAFTRTQLTYVPDKLKVRNVWGQHFTYILLEGLFAHPLLQYFVENDTFLFIGKDPKVEVPNLLRSMGGHGRYYYGFDWSRFDAEVQSWEIELAFKLLERMLEIPNETTGICWSFVRTFFQIRKIAAPDMKVYFKFSGVPSGSYFTILIDSIINYIRVYYLILRWSSSPPLELYTQGDDSVCTISSHAPRPNVVGISTTLKSSFGWTLNWDKSKEGRAADTVDFLSRTVLGADNYREPLKLERMALFTEYPVDFANVSTFRVKSILEESSVQPRSLVFTYEQLQNMHGIADEQDVPRQFRRHFQIREGVKPESM